jgi:transcriptional regulator GlxA family with amidase domain
MDARNADAARSSADTLPLPEVPPRGALSPRRVSAVVAYVDTHLDQPLSVRGLAAVAGLSPFHFARMFKAAVGASPHVYITNARVERAKRLLSGSNLGLREIARGTGYLTHAHFTSVFRRHAGVTPRVYRSSSRNALLPWTQPAQEPAISHEPVAGGVGIPGRE